VICFKQTLDSHPLGQKEDTIGSLTWRSMPDPSTGC